MSSNFGSRKTYRGSSDSVAARSSDIRDEEVVPSRLLNRRARFQSRDITHLVIDTRPKSSSLLVHGVDSPESPASPGSPGSPDSPDTPTIPAPAVGSSPGLALGAAEGPLSPGSPASPSGAKSPTSPPATTSLTTSQTTVSVSTVRPPPPSTATTSTVSTTAITLATTSSSSTSAALALTTKTTLLSSSTEKVGVPTTLAPLITASTKFVTSTTSSSISSSSSTTTTKASSSDGVTLDTTIAVPVSTLSTTTAEALPAVSSTDDATTVAQKGIKSDSGNVGVQVVLPVVFSVGVIIAFLVFFWLKRRRQRATPTEDQFGLSNGAAPMGGQMLQGQRQSLRFRSDGSVMADLMDAAYTAENGGIYRQSQLSTMQRPNAFPNEKVAASNPTNYTDMSAAPMAFPANSGNPVFSWLGGLRSGAPTVRGSVLPPRSEVSSTDRTTVSGWPQGFEPADPKANPLPENTRCLSYWSESSQGLPPRAASPPPLPALPSEMFGPRVAEPPPPPKQPGAAVRPLQAPPSPTQTAITYNTTAMTESSWNTWGVEQHPRANYTTDKKELWGKLKDALTGGR